MLNRAAIVAVILVSVALPRAASPRFYSDDPIERVPEHADASRATAIDVGLLYDLSYNLFVTAGRHSSNLHAQNVNTLDEVPDSSWFPNRLLPRGVTADEIVRGPNVGPPPSAGSMKNGTVWFAAASASCSRPCRESTHASRRIGMCWIAS